MEGSKTLRTRRVSRGFTIVELMVTIVIATFGIAAVAFLGHMSYTHFRTTTRASRLQADLDLAAFTLKGYIEEAQTYEDQGASAIVAYNIPDWQVRFYRDGAKLMLEWTDARVDPPLINTRIIIQTLQALSFLQAPERSDILIVGLTVADEGLQRQTSFRVTLKNFAN